MGRGCLFLSEKHSVSDIRFKRMKNIFKKETLPSASPLLLAQPIGLQTISLLPLGYILSALGRWSRACRFAVLCTLDNLPGADIF